MRALFRIAEGQLRGRPRQSLIALVSVAVGVAMLLVTLSLTGGLSEDFVAKAVETSAHVEILARRPAENQPSEIAVSGELLTLSRHHVPDQKQVVRPLPRVLLLARSIPGVVLATPTAEVQVVLAFGAIRRPALLSGVVPRDEATLTILDERVVAGSWEDFSQKPDGAVLGVQLAKSLSATVGAPLQALSPNGAVVPLQVTALVETGLASVDKVLVLVHLERAQTLLELSGDQATKVRLKLADPFRAQAVARQLQEQVGYVCLSWIDRSSAQIEAFDRQNLITRVLVFFTMLVSGFGVANVETQLVAQKRRDIAILRASGFSRAQILGIFLLQGTLLGVLGTAFGWLGGAALIRFVGSIPVDFGEAALLRNETLRMAEHPWYYLVAAALALVVCTLAALGPARRAARLLPTEILRGEH